MKRDFSWRDTDTLQHWIVYTVTCSCGWSGAARTPRAIREAENDHYEYANLKADNERIPQAGRSE